MLHKIGERFSELLLGDIGQTETDVIWFCEQSNIYIINSQGTKRKIFQDMTLQPWLSTIWIISNMKFLGKIRDYRPNLRKNYSLDSRLSN